LNPLALTLDGWQNVAAADEANKTRDAKRIETEPAIDGRASVVNILRAERKNEFQG
jgi:hypothetical protein